MKIGLDFKLRCGTRHDAEADVHVAWCPALDIKSQAESHEDSRQALTSAVTMYLAECYKRGIIEKVLSERGFNPAEPGQASDSRSGEFITIMPSPPKYDEFFDMRVPFELIANGKRAAGGDAWQS